MGGGLGPSAPSGPTGGLGRGGGGGGHGNFSVIMPNGSKSFVWAVGFQFVVSFKLREFVVAVVVVVAFLS